MSHDIFLSYSSTDYLVKDIIVNLLEAAGLNVYIDKKDIEFESPEWQSRIENEVNSAYVFILLVSPDANVAKWVREELTIAQLLEIEVFQILIRGDDFLSEPDESHLLDIRNSLKDWDVFLERLKFAIANNKQQGERPSPRNPQVATNPQSNKLIKYDIINYAIMKYITSLLDDAADLLTTQQAKGRASILWVDNEADELYIIAATDRYQDSELRLRLMPNEGYAGRYWVMIDNNPLGRIDFPRSVSLDYLQTELGLQEEIAILTRTMGVIISVPIFDDSGKLRAFLSLDKLEDKSINFDNFWEKLKPSRFFLKREFDNFTKPLAYLRYRRLYDVLRLANLISWFNVSIRSAIFLVNDKGDELYLAVGSEEFESAFSFANLRFKRGEGIIGHVWERGYLLTDDRENKTQQQVCQQWNMREEQYKVVKDTKSIVAAPIQKRINEERLTFGVLVVDSSHPMHESQLDEHRALIKDMAKWITHLIFEE